MAKIQEAPPTPGNDVYTGLLALSLVAMIIGCVLLYLDYSNYEGRNPPALPKLGIPAAEKTQSAPAQPRAPAESKAETKEGMNRPTPVVPDLTIPPLPAESVAAKPEPALLPTLPIVDSEVKPAEYVRPAPESKPAGEEPPVSIKPFTPN